jgi:inhibitor of KinA sporulation pathway (predicted exonuclease)
MPMVGILACGVPSNRRGGGLRGALKAFNLEFEGTPHRALDDAHNTARVCYQMVRMVRSFTAIEKMMEEAHGG